METENQKKNEDESIDWKEIYSSFLFHKQLPQEIYSLLLQEAKRVFDKEQNIISVSCENTAAIVGDTHGDYVALKRVLEMLKELKSEVNVFLGDYVDRGSNSIGVITHILLLKVIDPKKYIILRGNHEALQTSRFDLFEELTNTYGEKYYYDTLEVFNSMPICAVVNDECFCVHGGISEQVLTFEKINKIDRRKEPGLPENPKTRKELDDLVMVIKKRQELYSTDDLGDLLWSDPGDTEGIEWCEKNTMRAVGAFFGPKLCDEFLRINKLRIIFRAHMYSKEGFFHSFEKKNCVTVFSAPMYGGLLGPQNDGTIAVLYPKKQTYTIFSFDRSKKFTGSNVFDFPDFIKEKEEEKDDSPKEEEKEEKEEKEEEKETLEDRVIENQE